LEAPTAVNVRCLQGRSRPNWNSGSWKGAACGASDVTSAPNRRTIAFVRDQRMGMNQGDRAHGNEPSPQVQQASRQEVRSRQACLSRQEGCDEEIGQEGSGPEARGRTQTRKKGCGSKKGER
jgi:hypothetical protein